MKADNLTQKELMNIKKSFKDPKFHSLLGDYMMEISNPNNVEEQNEYMRQLLRENQLPKGSELLTPMQAFVLCSSIGAKGDRKFSQKLFVNICGHDKIDRAEMTPQEGGGNNWKVPYRVGKMRLSQLPNNSKMNKKLQKKEDKEEVLKENKNEMNVKKDSKKENEKAEIISIIEVVFNSETVVMCGVFAPFKKMVCDIALDAVRKLLEQKDQIVDKDYQVKEGNPNDKMGLIMIGNGVQSLEEPSNLKDKPDLYYDMMDQQEKAKKEKQTKKEKMKNDEEEEEDIKLELESPKIIKAGR
jgi:hypothetical protein